jgi:hypothetical protein
MSQRDLSIWTKVTFWITKAERDAFSKWCKQRGLPQNQIVLQILRTAMKPGFSPPAGLSPPPGPSKNFPSLKTNLEWVLWEAVRERDPIFAARIRKLLERVLLKHDQT